jgi:hypothetical protein
MATIKQLQQEAQDKGISLEELAKEYEVGSPHKPFVIALSFERLSHLLKFVEHNFPNLDLYRSDAFDFEFGKRGIKNHFVLRNRDKTSKLEKQRVVSEENL